MGKPWEEYSTSQPSVGPWNEYADDEQTSPSKEQWGGALGIPDAAANIVTGMGASAVGGLAGLGTLATGGSLEDADRNLSSIQDKYTWQPRTVEGKAISHVAGLPFEYATKAGQWLGEAAGKPFGLEDEGGLAGNLAAGAGLTLLGGRAAMKSSPNWVPNAKAAFDFAKAEAKGLRAPNAPIQYAPSKMAELQAKSIDNAPMLDALEAVKRSGGKVDPAVSNPTVFNIGMSMASGEGLLDNMLSPENAKAWGAKGAEELGIKNLSVGEFKAGRARAGVPYQEVKAIPSIASGADVKAALSSVADVDGMTPAIAEFVFKDISPTVNNLINAAEGGVNGADIVNLTRSLRKKANTTYKQEFPTPEAMAMADANLAISRALENLTAERLAVMNKEMPGRGYGDLASRWADARQYIANSHAWENATNTSTQTLNPRKFAKITAKDNALTGVAADVGKIANNMPGISKNISENRLISERATRYGVPGLVGWGLGSMIGMPGEGAMAGAVAGVAIPPLLRKLIASDKYQAKHAFPQDFRPKPTAPVVPEPIPAPNNGLALPYYAGEPLHVFPDGSTMTGAQAEAMRLANMVQPSNPKPMEFFRSNPLPIQKQAGISKGPRRGTAGIDLSNPTKVSGPSLMSLEEPISTKKISDLVEQIPFDTKFEVANHPLIVKATHDFIDQAANLKTAIAAETNGFKRRQLEAKLRGTEREFMAGWKELGFKNEAQLRDLTQKLYQTGGETQRGIVKTKSLKDLMQ